MPEWIFMEMNTIFVRTIYSIKTCVRTSLHFNKTFYTNIIRKQRIYTEQKFGTAQIFLARKIKVSKQLPCMYPGIRTSATQCFYILPANGRQGFIQHSLDRMGIVLDLPPMICGSVIGNLNKISLGRDQDANVMRAELRAKNKE